ncbi:hypothetical protein P389DRAFT_16183 [Cystobasidium minutum MCA 4210]|uniref:uncharacterized protein n=1 Tax=Cystobasidium minutum MCA 4210 TaxID=1397322 RepID=UPI0034CDAE68|eukprot:jgi/Rhomi1/16183/CE16182_214
MRQDMASQSSKRARSTSAAVDEASGRTAAPQRRKKSRSPLEEASHESDDGVDDRKQPEASTSRSSKPKAGAPRGVPQQQAKQALRRDDSNASTASAAADESKGVTHASTSTKHKQAPSLSSSTTHQSRKTGERASAVHRTSGANGRPTLMQEYADLQARHEEQQINYNVLREAYQALQELRETGAEAALREATALNEGRLNAMRKQVSNYKKESEELQAQADALKEEIATLADKQEGENAGESPEPRRRSRDNNPEEEEDNDASMEDDPREASTSRTTSSRKLDAAILNLQTELEEATQKNGKLQEEVDELLLQLENAKKEKKALSKQWAAEREQLELQLKEKWEKERRTLIQEKEELETRSTQLEKELAFEIEQSKKLQAIAGSATNSAQLKAAPKTPSNGAVQSATSVESSSTPSSDELVQLLLDFTGMTLVRRPQEGDKTYNFVMTDFKKRKALNFKLIVDHESGTVDFIPDLLPGRDDEVIESMENAIRGHIKFEYDLIQTFFKRLWRALNGHR